MFNLIIIGIIAIIGIIMTSLGYNDLYSYEQTNLFISGIVILGIAFIYFIFTVIKTLSEYTKQIWNFEKLHSDVNSLYIEYESQKKLLVEMKLYLGDKYPTFEKEIFENISNSNISMVLSYPDIRSSKTIKSLVSHITDLNNVICESKKNIETYCSNIRFINKSKWTIIKPSIPKYLKDIIFSNLKIKI